MAKRRLVISSDDSSQLFLLIEGDTITIGRPNTEIAGVLERVRVAHLHCVLEVEGEQITLRNDEADGPGTPQEVQAGEVLRAGCAQVCLQAVAGPEPAVSLEEGAGLLPVDDEPAEAGAPGQAVGPAGQLARRQKRLVVVDGADEGQEFMLPDSGTIILGKDRKHADIILHDFYVAKAHCRLKILGDKVEVIDDDAHGAQVNGKGVRRQELVAGDVLRVGNSHLKLEMTEPGQTFEQPKPAAAEEDEPIELTVEEEAEVEAADADAEEEVEEAPPSDAPEPVRLLHVWRGKLAQLSGQTFGHYKLGTVLGRGRCGVVFQAEDVKTGQAVALKVFSPQFPRGSQELQRFAAVMKGILPLRHPNLVALYGAGKTSTYTWVAREYVEGESVAGVVRRLAKGARRDERRACRVALHVGRALGFARQHHLRHGKIAPTNILIQASDKVVKLADLMLSGVLEGSQLGRAVQDYRPLAELGYLAPEQADAGAFVDELADMYGLGAVVYALLTGRPPFVGDTPEEVLKQARGGRVPRPSTINPDVSAPLEKVVMKMLARRQEDRYQTPNELLADLKPIAADLDIEG